MHAYRTCFDILVYQFHKCNDGKREDADESGLIAMNHDQKRFIELKKTSSAAADETGVDSERRLRDGEGGATLTDRLVYKIYFPSM